MAIPYTRSGTTLSVVVSFKPTPIPASHPNYQKIYDLVKLSSTTEQDIIPLLDIPKAIETFTGGNVTVVGGRLFYKGFEVKNTLATIILNFVKQGEAEAAKPFELFMDKAYANPDPRARDGLYDWVVASGLPITEQGDILAWKAVGHDYLSIRAGTRGRLRHRIGDVVEEPRHETDANPDQTCSVGIHFCAASYLPHYAGGGSRVMAVTISPTDVVAFPKDYGLAKGRACKLTVVGEVPQADVPTYYPQGRAVHSGWTAAPKKEVKSDFPVQVGDVWKTRGGSTVTVHDVTQSLKLVYVQKNRKGKGAVFSDTGRANGPGGVDTQNDFVELISRGVSPKSNFPIKVGDVWQRGDGRTVKVISTGSSHASGRFSDTNGPASAVDLRTGSNGGHTNDRDFVKLISRK